jgi:regulatory protein
MPFGRARKLDNEAELYEYAVGALARRMRSVAELKRLLRRRVEPGELGDTLVELIIAKLKEQKYLNDAQYASTYSSLRRENDKHGRRRVMTDLKARGVHSEVIEKAVAATYDNVNEEALARDYLRRKRLQKPADQKQTARIFRSLVRAGFGTRTIIAILKKWDVEDEVLSALETEEG